MDRYREMTVFVEVVQAGNFSAASRTLSMTPSAVNKQVSRLEDRLGVQLFQRSTKGLALTDAGRAYHQEASRILRDILATERMIARPHERPTTLFRMSSTVALARRVILPVLPAFMARNPNAQVELSTTNAFVDLLEANVDLAVRAAHLESSSLVARKLVSDVRVIAASPAYLEAHGEPLTPHDLLGHNCLVMPISAAMTEWPFIGPGGPYRVKVRGNFVSDSSDTLVQAALAGAGIVRLSMFMLGPALKAGSLRTILDDHNHQTDTGIYAIYIRSRHPSPLVRSFIDICVENLRGRSFDTAPPDA